MAAYKLTLTENDTGDVIVDEEIDCLIGAACNKDGTLSRLLFSACGPVHLAAANAGVQQIVKTLEMEVPVVVPLTKIVLTEAFEKDFAKSSTVTENA